MGEGGALGRDKDEARERCLLLCSHPSMIGLPYSSLTRFIYVQASGGVDVDVL